MRKCKVCGGSIRWTDIDGWVHVPLGSDHFGVPEDEPSSEDQHAMETIRQITFITAYVRDGSLGPAQGVRDIETLIHQRDPVHPRTSGRER